jgi:hypothetical protein
MEDTPGTSNLFRKSSACASFATNSKKIGE